MVARSRPTVAIEVAAENATVEPSDGRPRQKDRKAIRQTSNGNVSVKPNSAAASSNSLVRTGT